MTGGPGNAPTSADRDKALRRLRRGERGGPRHHDADVGAQSPAVRRAHSGNLRDTCDILRPGHTGGHRPDPPLTAWVELLELLEVTVWLLLNEVDV